jgi:hypothetical protein
MSCCGQPSTFRYETDWPLVRAESPEAMLFIIRELCNQGFLSKDRDGMPQQPPAPTWRAYQKLEELQASGRTSTGQRNGVYFEAGFAYGLGRKVIWMCNKAEKDDLHFDTRQFNHIMYTDLEEASKQLTDRIVALEDQGTYVADVS